MSCDRPARRCITSVDDRRCERGHPHTALGLGLRAATRVASLPTWVVTGGLSQLRTHTRRLERSCFTSRRSAQGPRSWLGGLIQPPAACYRPSQPKCGLNAALNVAPFTQAARFGHGEVRVCRNQRVVRARLISRPHRCFGDPERPGRPFRRHWSDFEPSRQFKAPWQARPTVSRGCCAQHVRRRELVVGCSRDGQKRQVLCDRAGCEAPRGAATARLQLTWLQPSRLSRRSLFARQVTQTVTEAVDDLRALELRVTK